MSTKWTSGMDLTAWGSLSSRLARWFKVEPDVLIVLVVTAGVLDFLLLKSIRAANKKEERLDDQLELAKRINEVSQSGYDYVNHIVHCDACKYSAPCPIGLMLHGTFDEYDKHLEELKSHG